MADLNNLGLRDDVVIIGDPDSIPEQPQGFSKLPQPRRYTFKLPENLGSAWERFDATDSQGKPIERVSIVFDADHPLTISEDPAKENVGETIRTRISDLERARGKAKIVVSDLFYFTRDGLGINVPAEQRNSEKVKAISAAAGKEFKADFEWSSFCNPKKDVYDDTGKKFEGVKGCGKRYYQSEVPKKDGVYLERFPCTGEVDSGKGDGSKQECGASLRCFGNLTRFEQVKTAAEVVNIKG